jgi:ribonucleoside-diphosphate reductase alpha chain
MELSNKILSDLTVYMKYARFVPEINRRESWHELVTRNKEMHLKRYPNLEAEIEAAYQLVYDRKVLPSMRSLQFGGKPIQISPNRIYNCAYLPIDDWRSFSEIMFLLLGGTGVGYSVQTHHVDQLPEIHKPNPTKHRRYLIGDSIEGWADAVKVLMKSYFQGGPTVNFDFQDIRPKGARLITSGGKAPGPQPLKECLIKIQGILENKSNGDKLSSIEVHDIVCNIADAVLAGGIRRAALISLFSADDNDMISCKSGAWWEMHPQRGRANNSAVLLRNRITKEFFLSLWEKIKNSGSGEPGIYFNNDKDWGTNPCISGDSLITVCDHGIDGGLGVPYSIPMKLLVEMCQSNEILPCALSYNEDTGVNEWKQITAAQKTKVDAEVLEIEYKGHVLRCTPDHKIYTKNRGWVEAKDLLETDELIILE